LAGNNNFFLYWLIVFYNILFGKHLVVLGDKLKPSLLIYPINILLFCQQNQWSRPSIVFT